MKHPAILQNARLTDQEALQAKGGTQVNYWKPAPAGGTLHFQIDTKAGTLCFAPVTQPGNPFQAPPRPLSTCKPF